MSTLQEYFSGIPIEERKNVKGIISSAYKNYLDKVPDYFPNSVSILNSFHVCKVIIGYLNDYLIKLTRHYKKIDEQKWAERAIQLNRDQIKGQYSQEVILLQHYKWVLLKNYDDINHSYHYNYHGRLNMHLTTYQVEEMFFGIDPRLKKLHPLKEEYISFSKSHYDTEEEAEAALNKLIELYDNSHEAIFYYFSTFLKSHKKEIIRSFFTVQVSKKTEKDKEEYYARLSNGLMESLNRKPKDYKRAKRGSSNFDYTRNRILWTTRNNTSILAVPKTGEEIHKYSLAEKTAKKRSKKYNTKKQDK